VDYGLNINRLNIPVNPYEVFQCDVPGIHSFLYFVLNDGFYPVKDKRNDDLPEKVIICSLREASEKYPSLVENITETNCFEKRWFNCIQRCICTGWIFHVCA
jgi:Fe-S cluster assembly protein SufD